MRIPAPEARLAIDPWSLAASRSPLASGAAVTVDEDRRVLESGAAAVDSGTIVGVGPAAERDARLLARRRIETAGRSPFPGLIVVDRAGRPFAPPVHHPGSAPADSAIGSEGETVIVDGAVVDARRVMAVDAQQTPPDPPRTAGGLVERAGTARRRPWRSPAS